eukprot:CAMPEP_0117507174 /NCGR_PEP_ID=MMETSP0784-20121206/26291_1 /TAXON_ID=39447 /ORGANISM="" /LENGTH=943 /DNA_ID=CAMNT_0005302677 /DNA_START=115 /DNA_END=2944 /DNA_ORIENTATION=+
MATQEAIDVAAARLVGMNLDRCLDANKNGLIDQVTLERALKRFDRAVFTDSVVTELVALMSLTPRGGALQVQDFVGRIKASEANIRPLPLDKSLGQLNYNGRNLKWVRYDNTEEARSLRRAAAQQTLAACAKGYEFDGSKKEIRRATVVSKTAIISASMEEPSPPATAEKKPALLPEIRYARRVVLEAALDRARDGCAVLAVNAASAYHSGGGFLTGGRHALEEAMCMQSSLYLSLQKAERLAHSEADARPGYHPERPQPATQRDGSPWVRHIPVGGAVLSPAVEVFRGGSNEGYPFFAEPVRLAGVASVAMFNKNPRMSDSPLDAPADHYLYMKQMKDTFASVLEAARQCGATVVVTPDAGCGVFKNDPEHVGKALGEALRSAVAYGISEVIVTGRTEFFHAVEKAANGPADEPHVPAFNKLLARSAALPYAFPTQANRLAELPTELQAEVVKHAEGTRPVVHHRVKDLIESFMAHKRKDPRWSKVYDGLGVAGLVRRLLTKRPLMFMTECDEYVLRDGRTSGKSTVRGPSFDDIGTFREQAPLVMEDYQSYDEMEISALLGMSVPTHFINTGGRRNQGRAAPVGTCEPRGIYVGLVGSRFERRNLMEWRHMVVTRDQNTTKNGYGQGNSSAPMLLEWAKLYGLGYLPTFEEAESIAAQGSERFVNLGNGTYLDTEAYRARCELTADMFLAEANERAEAEGAKALCHVVGLGLGVWQLHGKQVQIQADAYAAAARRLSLPHVAELHFSWFDSCSACGGVPGGGRIQTQDGGKILVEFGRRDPAEKLPTPAPGERAWLLVAQYAWDGNSYPGNEYWAGMLAASGDPAAASSSCIPELQNPEVNVEAFAVENVHIVPGASSRARRTLPREPTGFDKQEAAVHIQSVARGTSERRGYPVPGATEAAGPADTRMLANSDAGARPLQAKHAAGVHLTLVAGIAPGAG